MRGKLTRRTIDRLENLAIVLLSCSALLLLGWICTMQNIGTPWGSGESGVTFSGGNTTSSGRYRPAALMVQTREGRYGVQYDQNGVEALYANGLGLLLENTIAAADRPEKVGADRWQAAVSGENPWIWYDYLYDIPCPGWELPGGSGVRGFLIVGEGQRVKELYLYSDSTRTFFLCSLSGGGEVGFPALSPVDNGAEFAFAAGEEYEGLAPIGMLLPANRDLPVYVGTAPLSGLDVGGQRELMTAMGFNPAAVSLYQTAAGTVIREGADTLRLEKDGTLIFHGSLVGETRYSAASEQIGDLTERAMELLDRVLPTTEGMRVVCREALSRENGDTELRFSCLLNGVEVRFSDGAPAAKFVFRGSGLAGFTIRARTYMPTESLCPVLPVEQAAAIWSGMDRAGGELRLCYQDAGNGSLTVGWVLRAETEPE